jgi:hypothetical protein
MRDHLIHQFRLEEQGGYMQVVRERQPRLERAVRDLRDDHSLLSIGLQEAIRVATAAATVDDQVRQSVVGWVQAMREHEARENQLIEEAFDLDFGPGD